MARRIRIAAAGSLAVSALLLAMVGGAYYATRQVRPFYEQAIRVEPEVLQRGRQELESRATALYSDAKQHGKWHALFTSEQINGWLATQLADTEADKLPTNFRDPRVALTPDVLTLGFRTTSGGVETVISVDASVFLTEEGAVAIRLKSVRAGVLPLPVLPLAEEIAAACKQLSLPVRWTQQDGQPVAIVEIHSEPSAEKRQFFIDTIQLGDGELYVAGHTEVVGSSARSPRVARPRTVAADEEIKLADYELHFTPSDNRSALKIARRTNTKSAKPEPAPKRQPAG